MLQTLNSTLGKYSDYEIIIINDDSTDETKNWLSSLKEPNIKILNNASNLGYAKSNNLAVKEAKGEVLVLLNNDLEFSDEWLKPILDILQSPTLNAGIVGNVQSRILDGQIDHVGFKLSLNGKFIHEQNLPENSQDYIKTLAVTGACFAMLKSDFQMLGGFDEQFINGGEDIDLCLRIADRKEVYVSLKSNIKHHVALSRKSNFLDNEHNSAKLYRKWRSKIKSELAMTWRRVLSDDLVFKSQFGSVIDSKFLSYPHTASQIIAENILLREEHRWARELDLIDPNAKIDKALTVLGVRYNNRLNAYLCEDQIQILLHGVSSIRNFYVCGRKINQDNFDALQVCISINKIEHQIFDLREDSEINIGIINPILLPGIENQFTITAHYKNETGKLVNGFSDIAISHFVVDDHKIDRF